MGKVEVHDVNRGLEMMRALGLLACYGSVSVREIRHKVAPGYLTGGDCVAWKDDLHLFVCEDILI